MHRFVRVLSPVVILACACAGLRAADLSEEETKKAEAALKQLDDADAATRAAGETVLRALGVKVTPLLSKAKVENSEGHVRLRTILVDLTVSAARIDATDANTLGQLGREEALAKRWTNAGRSYRRAEQIYEKLKDDADDRKQKDKEKEYDDLAEKMDKRADKAEHLAKGETGKGVNLGFIKIGVDHDLKDEDW